MKKISIIQNHNYYKIGFYFITNQNKLLIFDLILTKFNYKKNN
jgi:hypothetical protein